jgi:preprotein translocase subunit SecD
MSRSACLLAALLALGSLPPAWSADKPPGKTPDGVYAVVRDSLDRKDVLPLKDGEVLLVNRHRYVKKDTDEPPRFLVVRSAPDVALDLAAKPKAVKEDGKVVRILLKLRPKAATALERLTRNHVGRQVTIVLGGEVVTMHKVRTVIKGGDVQITSCVPGAADHLLEQLEAHHRKK